MRIAVMGAGGIGGNLGGLLARDGNEVTLIARGAHLEAIRSRGLRIKMPNDEFTAHVEAFDDPAQAGPVDLVIFTVKTYHNAVAIPAIRPLMGRTPRWSASRTGWKPPTNWLKCWDQNASCRASLSSELSSRLLE